MPLKQFTTDFQNIGEQEFLRPNVGYRYFFDIQKAEIYPAKQNVNLKHVLKEIPAKKVSKGVLKDAETLIDIGNIERRFNNLIDLGEVDEIGSDKNILKNGDIVIPKMQPQMGNIFLNLEHKRYIGSTELLEYHISENYNPILLYYLITTRKFLCDLEKLESGKTHRRVNSIDLLKIKIPLLPKKEQDKIVAKIEPIEKKIRDLKKQIAPAQEVINKVFAREFKFNLGKVYEIDIDRNFYVELSQFDLKNNNLRSSYGWNQLKRVQKELYGGNEEIQLLGKFIKSTKNGWSPECNEDVNGHPVLGIDSIQKNGNLIFDNLKYTNQTRSNIKDFIIKSGDFFVSRGNTMDLVALASVAEISDEEKDCIYPDLMIKVEFDESRINKEYMAFVFNSIIGRIYFKYSAKGKNQTMVKISAKELYDFQLPIPDIIGQQKIVDEIKAELDRQEKMKKKIEAERDKIDEIIEKAVK